MRGPALPGDLVMTAPLIALFGGAGLIAVASVVATVKCHAASVRALFRQHDGVSQADCGHRKHLVSVRRIKPQPGWRARAWMRGAGRDLRRNGKLLAKQVLLARKSVHNWHYGVRSALLLDTLAIE